MTTLQITRLFGALAAIVLMFANTAFGVINIEIDYMVLRAPNGTILHSHQPEPEVIAAVVQMFACQGITANIVIDDEIPHIQTICPDPGNSLAFWGYTGQDGFGKIKADYDDHEFIPNWHYCVFGHNYALGTDCIPSGSSGRAELLGDDFIVTMGSFPGQVGTPYQKAATLAHELGHNLGLMHCGSPVCNEEDNYKTNFPSIMNYRFQLSGVKENMEILGLVHPNFHNFKNIDYSHGDMCTIDENALNETFGTFLRPIDWDCNGFIGGVVARDLNDDVGNFWCQNDGTRNVANDYNEWSTIVAMLDKRAVIDWDTVRSEDSGPCLTADEWNRMRARGMMEPPLISEPCINTEMVYVKSDAGVLRTGSCGFPYARLSEAINAAPNGSIIYLRSGAYPESSGPLIINRPLKITSVGTAVISVPAKK